MGSERFHVSAWNGLRIDNALVSKMSPLRVLLYLASQLNIVVHQMDITKAFLNSILEEEVFVLIPPGYEHLVTPGKYIKLLEALYGLKQILRVWNATIDTFL